ncbi:MAG: AzlD domain-containing protein [Oscillospiraceae bacterium]|nr:AzlD domain-containing protein [Oscillospiraceae bacterium]
MKYNVYLYFLVMAGVTFMVRALPVTVLKKPVTNRFFKSFLYYVPYATLSVMIFPAIINATQNPLSGLLALVAGIAVAWFGGDLFRVSVACCAVVFLSELIIM